MTSHLEILRAFGFTPSEAPESIYPYAPVYRVEGSGGQRWVVKKTNREAGGEAIARWTRSLVRRGVRTVCPAEGFGANPRVSSEASPENWVVYPFIEGERYRGTRAQLASAGALLGQIHAAGADEDHGLTVQASVCAVDPADCEEGRALVAKNLSGQVDEETAERAMEIVEQRLEAYHATALPGALSASLPLTNATWDYKASNLVYAHDDAPVLIDPDNGGRIPRLYDLAIAAQLFPNDALLHDAPARALSAADWGCFCEGYARHVTLTGEERARWPEVSLCAWVDEALWLLGDHAEGWASPRERPWLLDLLCADPARLALP